MVMIKLCFDLFFSMNIQNESAKVEELENGEEKRSMFIHVLKDYHGAFF